MSETNNNKNSYISCNWIESAITFFPNSLSFCCGGMKGNFLDYYGEEFPIEKYLARKKQLLEDIQIGKDSPCQGCRKLENIDWPKQEYIFNKIVIANDNLCNLKCTYCRDELIDKDNTQDKQYDVALIVKGLLKDGLMSPKSVIAWGDGEPVMLKSFVPIMELALQYGMKVDILSNCTKYSDLVAKGLSVNLVSILCSVDAGTTECYKSVRGRDLIDTVWNNLRQYAKIDSSAIKVKYVFIDDNSTEDEIKTFIKRVIQSGIKQVVISQNMYKYRAPWSRDVKPMPDEIRDGIVIMLYEAYKNGIHAELQSNYFLEYDVWIIKLKLLEKIINVSSSEHYHFVNSMLSSFIDDLIEKLNVIEKTTNATPITADIDMNEVRVKFKRLQDIESSFSWRVTEPLRNLGKFLTGI